MKRRTRVDQYRKGANEEWNMRTAGDIEAAVEPPLTLVHERLLLQSDADAITRAAAECDVP